MNESSSEILGIIGSGRMGADIFYYLLEYPFRLIWVCETREMAERARALFLKKTSRLLAAGAWSVSDHAEALGRVAITTGLSGCGPCGIIIEAVTESLQVKGDLLAGLEAAVPEGALILSNSSSFVPSRICGGLSSRGRLAGLHFFFPVKLKSFCELISGPDTSPECFARAEAFCRKIGKIPLVQDESSAFFINKILLPVQAEACRILEEEPLSPASVDRCVAEELGPGGIFLFMDSVGLDVMAAAVQEYAGAAAYGDFVGPLLRSLGKKVREGRLGKKSGAGYVCGDQPLSLSVIPEECASRIRLRLCAAYVNAACRILEQGLCDPETLEAALRDYTDAEQGPFGLARKIGVDRLREILLYRYDRTGLSFYKACPVLETL